MKKTFHQLHIINFFELLLYLFFIGGGVCLVLMSVIKENALMLIVGIVLIVLFTASWINTAYNRIIFYDNRMLVTGQLFGDDRTQYKDEILYSDIEGIRVIYVIKNSKKESIKTISYVSLRPNLFFEFVLKNQKTKWVWISLYSKRQRDKMLKMINEKTGLNLCYDEIEKNDLSPYNLKKK